jgi:hypothetical protein
LTKTNSNAKGVIFLVLAMLIISQQSIAVKWLGGSYLVLEWLSMDNYAWW